MKDRTDRKTLPDALPAEQKEKNNRVKWYGVVWGIGLLIFQHSMYLLANVIAGWIGIPPFLPKIEAIDDLIPLVPVFVLPYIWSYYFWAMAPMAVSPLMLAFSRLMSLSTASLLAMSSNTFIRRVFISRARFRSER